MSTRKNQYKFQLKGTLTTAGTSVAIGVDLETEEAVELDAGTSVVIQDRTGAIVERTKASATGGVITFSERGLDRDSVVDAALKKEWSEGALCYVTVLADQVADLEEDNTWIGDQTVEGNYIMGTTDNTKYGFLVKRLTTTQRDALVAPPDGVLIYNTTAGAFQVRESGAWNGVGAGASTPNADSTTAGKVEGATTAQVTAGTSAGETLALLFATPAQLAAQIQSNSWLYAADAGGDDAYVGTFVPVVGSYVAGQVFFLSVTTANTGACTFDAGPGAKNIKTKDGNDPQTGALRVGKHILIYDGTDMILQSEDFGTVLNKGVYEMCTDAEVTTGTDEARVTNAKQMKNRTEYRGIALVAGTTYTAASANTERSTSSTSYVKLKEFLVTKQGIYTTSFELKRGTAGDAYGRIYVNGVATGAEHFESGSVYAAQTDNITVVVGDLIQLYAKKVTTDLAYVKNFNMKFAIAPQTYVATVNTD